MKKILLVLVLIDISIFNYSKEFRSFKLMYNIPQQINTNEEWPKYILDCVQIYNDTVYTLLIKKGYISSLSIKEKKSNNVQ